MVGPLFFAKKFVSYCHRMTLHGVLDANGSCVHSIIADTLDDFDNSSPEHRIHRQITSKSFIALGRPPLVSLTQVEVHFLSGRGLFSSGVCIIFDVIFGRTSRDEISENDAKILATSSSCVKTVDAHLAMLAKKTSGVYEVTAGRQVILKQQNAK